MGDGVSIPTNIIQGDTVARAQAGQQTNRQVEEQFTKALRNQDEEAADRAQKIDEAQKLKLHRKKEEERKKKREEKKKGSKEKLEADSGNHIDLKV